jgi:hypothetical protein
VYTARWRALRVNPNRVDTRAAQRDVERFMWAFLYDRIKDLQRYPPVPSGSRYRRTGDLGRGWRPNVQITLSEISGYLWNSATDRKSGREYMTYVQGPWQTLMHQQTGWTTISDVRAARAQQYRADLQAIYSRHIRKGP